jgi:hypothetical protein
MNFNDFRCYASAMALASVTLSYLGMSYTFAEDDQTVLRGRLACDCEKSRLIREECDSDFPVLKCGARIAVVSVTDAILAGERRPIGGAQNNPLARSGQASL